jgi:hypothetical protein
VYTNENRVDLNLIFLASYDLLITSIADGNDGASINVLLVFHFVSDSVISLNPIMFLMIHDGIVPPQPYASPPPGFDGSRVIGHHSLATPGIL